MTILVIMILKTSIILFCSIFTGMCFAQKKLVITNPTDGTRKELVSIPYAKFTKHFGVDSLFKIEEIGSTKQLPYQLEKLGEVEPQNVLIQVDIPANGTLSLQISPSKTKTTFPAKTYARFVPERLDDFAWENDVIAFRIYGKALEGHSDDAQGIDIWSKRTENLIIDKWYKAGDYHTDHGEGMDYYSVGQTMGAGDIALFFNNKIYFTKHYRQYKVLDNGPLRSTFILSYETEDIEGQNIALTKTISLDAGQHFNKISVDITNNISKRTPIIIGLAKRKEQNPEYDYNAEDFTLSYWEPDIKGHGRIGTALVLPKEKWTFNANDEKQFLLDANISNGKPLVYYNGAAWDRAGKITSADTWEGLVEKQKENIEQPLMVRLK